MSRLATSRAFMRLLLLCLLATATAVRAGELFQYEAAEFGKARLQYIDGLPVLELEGSPAEMGRQAAALTSRAAKQLIGYPKRLATARAGKRGWAKVEKTGRPLLANFPPHHKEELEAFARQAGIDAGTVAVANVMVDVYRVFGCSSLLVEPQRSATGGMLFGRNLDFHSLGIIHKYTIVTVYRPTGKHAFASVGFPGLVGCLSGMNDVGLALAVHEVLTTRDGSPMLDKRGTPYALCFRRILEECTTIEEAEQLLKQMKRTTRLNLALCDREHAGVLEITPKNVVLRRSEGGICACTNHFRTATLTGHIPQCRRYKTLREIGGDDKLDVSFVAKKLHAVNMGQLTLQTMIFEPKSLKLHLAIGTRPSSQERLKEVDLSKFLGK
jgi:isopenicillin-N N-acyltransferase-like protein